LAAVQRLAPRQDALADERAVDAATVKRRERLLLDRGLDLREVLVDINAEEVEDSLVHPPQGRKFEFGKLGLFYSPQ
jgi:hypothetical protein